MTKLMELAQKDISTVYSPRNKKIYNRKPSPKQKLRLRELKLKNPTDMSINDSIATSVESH